MDRKPGWLRIVVGTLWVGVILWALTYKLCADYFAIELQGSIVIAVGLLLVWLLAFRLLNFMLRMETIRNLKILIMSFICGVVFAIYFPIMLQLVTPKPGDNPTPEAKLEAVPTVPVPVVTPTSPPPATTAVPAYTPTEPFSPPAASPPITEEKPTPAPPKPVVDKKPEPAPTTPEIIPAAGETAGKPTEEKPPEKP